MMATVMMMMKVMMATAMTTSLFWSHRERREKHHHDHFELNHLTHLLHIHIKTDSVRVVDLPIALWRWAWQDGWMLMSGWRWRWWMGWRGVDCGPVCGGRMQLHLARRSHVWRLPRARPKTKGTSCKVSPQISVWLIHNQIREGTLTNINLSLLLAILLPWCALRQNPHWLVEDTLPLRRWPCFHKFPRHGSVKIYCPHNPATAPALQSYKHSHIQALVKNPFTHIPLWHQSTWICVKVLGVTSASGFSSFKLYGVLISEYRSFWSRWLFVHSVCYQNVRQFMWCGKIKIVPQMAHRSAEPLRMNSWLCVWKDLEKNPQTHSVAQKPSVVPFSKRPSRQTCWESDLG